MSRPFFSCLRLAAVMAVFWLSAAGASAAQWETLTGIRLRDSGYFDGDSFHLSAQGKDYIFRLYFVDAPETAATYPDRVEAQGKYFGVDLKRTLEVGEEARVFARSFLRAGGVTVHTCWEDARGASAQPRFYAILESAKGNLAEELIKNGLARVYGMPTPDRLPGGKTADAFIKDLERLEAQAKRAKVGGWGDGTRKLPEDAEAWPFQKRAATAPPPPIAPVVESKINGRVNLNGATAEELIALPKIGPVYARKIIEGRPWSQPEDIAQIAGLTEASVAQILDLIYAGPMAGASGASGR